MITSEPRTAVALPGPDSPDLHTSAASGDNAPGHAERRRISRDGRVSEIAASHAVYVSQPQVVADLIKQAAAAAGG